MYLNSQISFCLYVLYSLFNNGCLGYVFLENCYDFICHKTVVSPFQYLLATLHPALMVDCVMNPSLDLIAHVPKDLMERFVKLQVNLLLSLVKKYDNTYPNNFSYFLF